MIDSFAPELWERTPFPLLSVAGGLPPHTLARGLCGVVRARMDMSDNRQHRTVSPVTMGR